MTIPVIINNHNTIIVGSQCHDLLRYQYIVHPFNCESALGHAWECMLILGCTWIMVAALGSCKCAWIVGVHLDHGSCTWIM